MNTYSRYWLLTALLLCGVIYLVWSGTAAWGIAKFPEAAVRGAVLFVLAVFLYTYGYEGHGVARMLSKNEMVLPLLARGTGGSEAAAEISVCLHKTASLRRVGATAPIRQADFSVLYYRQKEAFEHALTAGIDRIESYRNGLFFLGLAFTAAAIVAAFAAQMIPTNSEEARLYSFAIIKALGLSYTATLACLSSMVVLYVLGTMLRARADQLIDACDGLLYETAILGLTRSGSHA